MLTQEQLQTTQDYLDAADREFENADAVAGTERLWDAMTHTLTAVATGKAWPHDKNDLYPIVEQLAKMDVEWGDILLGIFCAAGGYPDLVRSGYFRFEDGDTHRARRLVHEFISKVQELAD